MAELTDREQLVQLATKMDFVVDTVTSTQADVKELDKKVDLATTTLEKELRADMVTKDEFEPIKKFVYGAASVTLTVVALAIIAIAISNGNVLALP